MKARVKTRRGVYFYKDQGLSKQISIHLPEDVYAKLIRIAAKSDLSLQKTVLQILKQTRFERVLSKP